MRGCREGRRSGEVGSLSPSMVGGLARLNLGGLLDEGDEYAQRSFPWLVLVCDRV